MRIPHRDNPAPPRTGRPDDHHHPLADISGGDEPDLAILSPLVPPGRVLAREHPGRIGKIEPTLNQRRRALGRIERHLHEFNVTTKIDQSKRLPGRGIAVTVIARNGWWVH